MSIHEEMFSDKEWERLTKQNTNYISEAFHPEDENHPEDEKKLKDNGNKNPVLRRPVKTKQ